MQRLPDRFLAAGSSSGAGMAEYLATQRLCSGVLMMSGVLPVQMLGAHAWPTGAPAQIHYTEGDPRRRQDWVDAVVEDVRVGAAEIEGFTSPGADHLFNDPSESGESDEQAAALLWQRALVFCRAPRG